VYVKLILMTQVFHSVAERCYLSLPVFCFILLYTRQFSIFLNAFIGDPIPFCDIRLKGYYLNVCRGRLGSILGYNTTSAVLDFL